MNKEWIKDYVAEIVYGGVDGVVTTFAIVAASAGAGLSSTVIFVLGFANLFADGFSMGVSSYLAKKTEVDGQNKKRRGLEATLNNDNKRASSINKLMSGYGIAGNLLGHVTKKIADDPKASKSFLRRHNDIETDIEDPKLIGIFTFTAFIVVGAMPLSIYIADLAVGGGISNLFLISSLLAAAAFVLVGYFKSKVTHSPRMRSIVETLLLGTIAALIAFGVGFFLDRQFG